MQAINSTGNGVEAKYEQAPVSGGVSGSSALGKKPIFGLKSGGAKKAFAKPAFAGFGKKPLTIAKRDVKPSNDEDFINNELAAISDQQKQLIEPIEIRAVNVSFAELLQQALDGTNLKHDLVDRELRVTER